MKEPNPDAKLLNVVIPAKAGIQAIGMVPPVEPGDDVWILAPDF